jgi:uncharacterized membrane protein
MADPQNPYETPSADLGIEHDFQPGELLGEPRRHPFGRGAGWIAEAWNYFRKSPLNWILMVVVLFALTFLVALIPFVGSMIINVLYPVLFAGILLACQDLDAGRKFSIERLFAGFSIPQRNRLLILGVLYIVFSLVMLFIIFAVFGLFIGIAGMEGGLDDPDVAAQIMETSGGPVFALAVLVAIALTIPVIMAFYFAPALITFNDLEIMQALKLSFRGCLRNIMPFLLFGIIMILLSILAMIPLGLGMLIMAPVGMITLYVCYNDIFLQE